MTRILKGGPVAQALTKKLAERVDSLSSDGTVPTLAVLRVGKRADDLSYERGACKRCEAVGIAVRKFVLPEQCTQCELMDAIEAINSDTTIHGCLMFRPLPAGLDERAACEAIDESKDVDCVTSASLCGVFCGREVGFPPCTAEACIEVLDFYGYELSGANIAVVGRSLVVGKPVSMMLQSRNATVTMCHTRTRDLQSTCRNADIIVVAAGHCNTIGKSHVSKDSTVIDVGINWDADKGCLCGDVAFDEISDEVLAVTPVPGGVGAVTTAILAKHVVEAAERSQR